MILALVGRERSIRSAMGRTRRKRRRTEEGEEWLGFGVEAFVLQVEDSRSLASRTPLGMTSFLFWRFASDGLPEDSPCYPFSHDDVLTVRLGRRALLRQEKHILQWRED
jgi:hypothetical protein